METAKDERGMVWVVEGKNRTNVGWKPLRAYFISSACHSKNRTNVGWKLIFIQFMQYILFE